MLNCSTLQEFDISQSGLDVNSGEQIMKALNEGALSKVNYFDISQNPGWMQNESIVSNLLQWLDRQTRLFDFNCCHNEVSTEVLMQIL